mgnify:FL=1|tara:strand:- start:766 stop:990 length:225 start_codon:yes stop_codon:yes gene_type:complete
MNEFEKFEEQGGKVNLRVSPELRKKIKQVSLDREVPMQSIVEYVLRVCIYAIDSSPTKNGSVMLNVELDLDQIK